MFMSYFKRFFVRAPNTKVLYEILSPLHDSGRYMFNTHNYNEFPLWNSSVSFFSSDSKPFLEKSVPGKSVRKKQLDLLTSYITTNDGLSEQTLKDLKKSVFSLGSDINKNNFDAIFIDLCAQNNAFIVGKSFFQMLRSNSRVNLASVGKFLKLCFSHRDLCQDEDRQLIKLLCHELIEQYPVLDVGTYESIICGLSLTDSWKEALDILKKATDVGLASSVTYSSIAEAAFVNNHIDLGWSIMDELMMVKRTPSKSVYETWLRKNKNNDTALNRLLTFISHHSITPSVEIGNLIVDHYQCLKQSNRSGIFTKISPKGVCNSCKKSLQPVNVSQEEFIELRDSFLKPVLIGKDVFLKSKPSEIDLYLKFLTKSGKVDVVLDGLNIAYAAGNRKSSPNAFSKLLKDVVKHFVSKNMSVMVIGRKHMMSWPKKNMDFIFKFSSLFLADNVSSDDPLLLFGAMYSGLGTIFVSRDLMKGHKFLLKEPHLRQIFTKWQQKHQYYLKYVDVTGNVTLEEPLPYFQDAHRFNGVWHIPINSGDQPGVLPQHRPQGQTWLCLQ